MSETTKADYGSNLRANLGLAQADQGSLVLCVGWAALSAGAFLLFRLLPAEMRSIWFPILVSLLKVGAFLMSGVLCWRNSRDASILSGRAVWQAIALGLLFYALGDITVILWRSVWGITSAVSLGDVFYSASYLFLSIGLLSAILPRRVSLNVGQSLSIAAVGIVGIVLACWLNFYPPEATSAGTGVAGEVAIAPTALQIKGAAIGTLNSTNRAAPAIVQLIDRRLSRITSRVDLLYVIGDCALIVMAAALLVAFWGGTYSEAWKLIALAGLCLYVADMFLIYEVSQGRYVQGALWEIFWILSALFFGLAAGVERGISAKMQRKRSRKQWL